MNALRVFCVLFAAAWLNACANDGTIGPKLAAVPSAGIAGSAFQAGSAAPGVAPGGLISGLLDDLDRQRASAAEMRALESSGPGTPVSWKGDNGAYGTVIAGPAYARPGYPQCRDYSHTIYVQGKPQTTRGAACRSADGSWIPVT